MANINLYDLNSNKINDNELKGDFRNAKKFGPISVGKLAVYYRDGLKRKALRLTEIDYVFTRTHRVRTHVCCGMYDLFIFSLVLNKDGEELAEIKTESERYVNLATEEILQQISNIKSAYSPS
ncbi:MAG: hypothetical protein ACOX04_04690 [Candidatus Scatomorpha sp.]|jgi:hypothetical protein